VYIPLFPGEPLHDEKLKFLEPGVTTLTEIKEKLWEPTAIRNNGKLLLYKESRETALLLTLGIDYSKITAFLIIELDEDDKLSRFEVLRSETGIYDDENIQSCTSWGICLDMHMLYDESFSYTFLGPQVKQSELEYPPDGQCQIITYLSNGRRVLWIQIDENSKQAITEKGFTKNIVIPGNHTIKVHWRHNWETTYDKKTILKQNISCNSNESIFVNVFTTREIIRPLKVNLKIEPFEEALKTIRERRVIID
jgi:hypothetical protein